MQQVSKEVGHFSLSAEIWRSQNDSCYYWYGTEKYMVLLCHHLNAAFEPATFPLGVVNTADGDVDDLVKVIMKECGLSMKNASLLLSNNDKMVCKLAADLHVKRFPDIWAVVQSSHVRWIRLPRSETTTANAGVGVGENGNATGDQLGNWSERPRHIAQLNVARVIPELKKLADYFDNHWDVKKTLLRTQITGGDEDSMMIRKTQCNSWDEVYDFLIELMIWRPSINRFFASSSTSSITEPTPKMWFVAEALVLLWRTLRDVLQITTKEKARTLPFMIHCLVITKQQLNQENALEALIKHYRLMMEFDATEISRDLLTLQRCILEDISKNFDFLLSELLCSLLDPRYAKMEHVSEDKRELCKTTLIEQAVDLNRKDSPAQGLMYTLLQEEDTRSTNDVEMEKRGSAWQMKYPHIWPSTYSAKRA